LRAVIALVVVAGLSACTSVDSSGNPTSGGSTGVGDPQVQAATRVALAACADAVSVGAPLSSLQRQGFAAFRDGYQRNFGSPGFLMVEQTVTASMGRRGGCTVEVVPGTLFQVSFLRSLALDAMAARGQQLDGSVSTTSSGIAATLR
jgi:hypothetical protein